MLHQKRRHPPASSLALPPPHRRVPTAKCCNGQPTQSPCSVKLMNLSNQSNNSYLIFWSLARSIATSQILSKMKQMSPGGSQKLQSVSQHFDMRGEKKLQSNLSEQSKVIEIELQKQKQASTIHASQLSHIEAALDSQAASFESEFEALNSHIKKLQDEKSSKQRAVVTASDNVDRHTSARTASCACRPRSACCTRCSWPS